MCVGVPYRSKQMLNEVTKTEKMCELQITYNLCTNLHA